MVTSRSLLTNEWRIKVLKFPNRVPSLLANAFSERKEKLEQGRKK